MTDMTEHKARALLEALQSIGDMPPRPESRIEALERRWGEASLGNYLIIESPAGPDQWVLTLVTAGWPREKRHHFESGTLDSTVTQAVRWLDSGAT
jgi:hypothetical protein